MPVANVNTALNATEIVANLALLAGWNLTGEGTEIAIEKTYAFSSYLETLAFVNAAVYIAHRMDHHPSLLVNYGSCTVRLSSHDIQGLSGRDFAAAEQIDALRL
ncbi:MAG: 4a-hydroxytetrahydrobiopterin dehydratase [Burkholderiaceae bacterium]